MLYPGDAMQPSLAEPRYATLHVGDQPIPGFYLVRRRGRGGFGEVWESEASGGFLVALKFVRLSSRAQSAELRALEFVRGIHHPNLLSNFGSWQVDDTLIIGMELADRSLWDRQIEVSRQGLRGIPRGELLNYLAEVASGIAYLNEYRHTFDGRTGIGVQHRDLKPSNILLFGGGAKVADLGLARAMEGEIAGHTGTWTFSYAAPEFFRGETTRQSDQYSLAVTYCQLRGGRLPYEGSAASVTAGHLFGRPDLEALPEPERPIVERALAKVPGDRWPDCRAFIDALRALSGDSVADILVEPDGPYEIPREFRSSTSALFNFATGSGEIEGGTPVSEWLPVDPDLRSESKPSCIPAAPKPENSASPKADEDPLPTDFVPTRLLPSAPLACEHEPTTEPLPSTIEPAATPETSPGIARRRPPFGRRTAATMLSAVAMITAIVLAATGVYAPTHDHTPAAANFPPSSPDLVLADGIGFAAGLEFPPIDPSTATLTPLPAMPIGAIAASRAPEPEPVRTELPPPPAVGEPRPAATARPVADASPVAPATPPHPVPVQQARPPLVLEGPLEMDLTDSKANAPLPDQKVAETPERKVPVVAAPKAIDAMPPPGLDKDKPARIATPPIPARSPPGALAFNNPSASLNPAPAAASIPNRLGPSPAEAAFARGKEAFLGQSFTRAVVEFDAAIRLDPGHLASYLPRAIARHRAGDPRAALADYADVIRVRPDDVFAYISRGQAYHELGAYDRAIADYDEAIRRRPADADALLRRGLARYRSGDHAGSIADFTATLRLDPQNARASEFRADALARLNAKNAPSPTLGATPARPATTLTPLPASASANEVSSPVISRPSPASSLAQGSDKDQSAIRETTLLAPPGRNGPAGGTAAAGGQPRNEMPAARPGPNQAPPERRRPAGRRLFPWPLFPRSR